MLEGRQYAVVQNDEVVFVGTRAACEKFRKGRSSFTVVSVDMGTLVGDKINEDAEKDVRAFGGFSKPSKMPGSAIGYPAKKACPLGKKLCDVPGSVCSQCYAQGGQYQFPVVRAAQDRRYHKLKSAMRTGAGEERWINGISTRLQAMRIPWFRWHDSGDLQNMQHLMMIFEVANRTPKMRHWIPTKELVLVRKFLENDGRIPDNVNIRISAPMIGQRITPAGMTTSSVSDPQGKENGKVVADPGFQCPATYEHDRPEKTKGRCMDCRACWERSVPNVDYELH